MAIVGPTGAGKTTLVNLLMRFYEVDRGRITVDGIETRELTRDNLRRTFGMVLQDTWLFNGTIRENIAYGAAGAVGGRLQDAVDAAHVDHFVRTLPDGLRHRPRRRRDQRLRGREAAADDRPGLPGRPADPHPGRGDLIRGHAHRGADPEGDEPADGRPDDVRDRPPAVHDPRRGRDPGDERGPDRGAGHARGAAGAGASTTSCTRASSRRHSTRSRRAWTRAGALRQRPRHRRGRTHSGRGLRVRGAGGTEARLSDGVGACQATCGHDGCETRANRAKSWPGRPREAAGFAPSRLEPVRSEAPRSGTSAAPSRCRSS